MSTLRDRTARVLAGKWHDCLPEISMRYVPVAKLVTPGRPVVEIGSGPFGITSYLEAAPIGVDLSFSTPTGEPHSVKAVRSSVLELPFASRSVDTVICMDMLEHLPPDLRAEAVIELTRVTKCRLILGMPTGHQAQAQDAELDQIYLRQHGQRYPFLTEHVEYGLPTSIELESWVRTSSARRNPKISMHRNSNLRVRRILMRLWIKGSPISHFLTAVLTRLTPLLSKAHFGSCYRSIVVVDFLS